MALKAFVDNLNDVPKELHVHYVQEGGKYRLDAEGVEDVTGLKTALERERDANRDAQKRLKAFEGLDDPAAAIKALETMKNIDQKKLIDAGEVDKVKKEISDGFACQVAELTQKLTDKDGHIYKLEVSNRFAQSKFINEKTVLPPDIAEATFGKNFKVEDGRVVGYIGENRIYKKTNPAELADLDEALEVMIDSYPLKDRIMKASGKSGSGAEGGGKSGNGKVMNRTDFDALSPKARAEYMESGGTLQE
jgi:hypothetical protein